MKTTGFDAKEKRDLLTKGFSSDEIKQLEIQRDPSLWAETYLIDPEHPRQSLKLRSYQKTMVSYQGRKKVYRCVSEDCKVLLSNGLWVSIKDIKPNDIVVSYDKYKLKDGKVLNTFNNGVREVFRVLLNNGSYIDVTSDHELFAKIKTSDKYLLSKSGFNDKSVYRSKTKTLWSTIDDGLKVGDNVCVIRGYVSNRRYLRKQRGCSKSTKWEKILSITSLGNKNVYDIEVDEYHNFICNGIVTHNCGRRIGKCKKINDLHILTDGRRLSYGQLLEEYQQGIQNEIFVFNEDTQKIETTKDFSVWSNGVKSLIKLTTETGRVESATSNHPFLVIRDGEFKWVELGSLKLKDRIACPKKLDMITTKSIYDTNSINVASFLGYLVGDGGLTHSVIFTNNDLAVIEHLKNISISLGFTVFRFENIKDKDCYNLHIKAGDNKKWARHLLEEFNLYGKKSIDKEVPEQLYKAPKEEIKAFLSALYECDGWASVTVPQNNRKSGGVQIGYCSSSYKLAEGVKHLLLRFGIIARLKEKKVNLKGKEFLSYQVTINDRENILRFIDEINFSCTKKQTTQLVKEELEKKDYCDNSSLYTIPKDIYTRIKKIQEEKNLTTYQVLGNTSREDETRLRSCYDFSREKVSIYANNLNDDFLKKLCNNDIIWEKIVKLEDDGQHETVDLTVEKYHNFVGNDIISHNSISICVEALWLCFVNEGLRVLICTPYKTQTANLWKDGFNKLIKGNQLLEQSISKMGQNPYLIEFKNGSRILGLTAGSSTGNKGASIRGQNADVLILDEVDYMGDEAIQTIQAIAATSKDTRLIISSTPSGKREYFYDACHNKNLGFQEFYYPSSASPNWVSIVEARKQKLPLHESQEYLFRNTVPESEYKHEYEAEFGEENQGVFKHKYIDSSLITYDPKFEETDANGLRWYCGSEQKEGNVYSMGVDWNGTKVGTQIVITEYCLKPTDINYIIEDVNGKVSREHMLVERKYRTFYRESVSIEEMTQLHSIHRIIELTRKFRIDHIYVDAGFGTTNIEELKLYGKKHPESNMNNKLVSIDFASKITVFDPFSKEEVEKSMKPFCVNNAVTCLERNELILPDSEDEKVKLVGQMREYRIEKISPLGTPRYSEDNDHILDAFMLSLLAFQLEYSELVKLKHTNEIASSKRPTLLMRGLSEVGDRTSGVEKSDVLKSLGVKKRSEKLEADRYHSDSRGGHMDYEDLYKPNDPKADSNLPFRASPIKTGWATFNVPKRSNF